VATCYFSRGACVHTVVGELAWGLFAETFWLLREGRIPLPSAQIIKQILVKIIYFLNRYIINIKISDNIQKMF
jgi:hypothetical protein